MSTQSNQDTKNTRQAKAYNISIQGFGYLNRLREVAVERGEPYLSLDVALMEGVVKDGDYSNITKTYLAVNVKGAKAKEIIRAFFTRNGKVNSPDTTVVASVNLGGITPTTFVYQRGDRKGETGASIKTNLLKINWLKIGDRVIDLSSFEDQEPVTDEAKPAEAVS